LADEGFFAEPEFLPPALIDELAEDFLAARERGLFRRAGIGQGAQIAADVRRDEILWFEPTALAQAQVKLWARLNELKSEINEGLFLGLFDLEGHYACYPPGGFYEKHVDRFATSDLRTVSVVLYLNRSWKPGDGGELAVYLHDKKVLIEPRAGTLVCFLSDQIEHEVQTSNVERMSFAGWFRRRPN
jgi:SM-20-related protein